MKTRMPGMHELHVYPRVDWTEMPRRLLPLKLGVLVLGWILFCFPVSASETKWSLYPPVSKLDSSVCRTLASWFHAGDVEWVNLSPAKRPEMIEGLVEQGCDKRLFEEARASGWARMKPPCSFFDPQPSVQVLREYRSSIPKSFWIKTVSGLRSKGCAVPDWMKTLTKAK